MKKWSRIKYHPCLPLGKDGRRVTSCQEHIDFAHRATCEGMVLLKNNGILPLKKGAKVAVFGKAQFDYVKQDGGSADSVRCKYTSRLNDGLSKKEAEGKLMVFPKTRQFYEENLKYEPIVEHGFAVEPDLPESLVKEAAEFADTAIITICRFSSENSDHEPIKGDYYLNDAEEKMIDSVCNAFNNVIVLLNIGGVIDTTWFKDNKNIHAALITWYGGMEGGFATADILTGDVNPSGRLVDTFPKSYDDFPSAQSFIETDAFAKYYEDIYVGYRYFETIPGAAEKVNYPFGFGLSYTTFSFSDTTVWADDEKIYAKTTVANTGDVKGRQVVQVYYSAPQGLLGKPARELAAFAKTKELAPGEKETLSMEFNIADMASYDDTGKCAKSAYILEKGDYTFHIGSSVRDTEKSDFVYTVAEDFRIIKQLSEQMTPVSLEKRMRADGTYEDMPKNFPKKPIFPEVPEIPYNPQAKTINFEEVANGTATMDDFIAQLTPAYMASLLGGKGIMGISDTGGIGGTVGNSLGGVDEYGVPCATTCDGPTGIRVGWDCGIEATVFPSSTLLACSWDTNLFYEHGRIGALEVKENNMAIWLTPSINIHRNPLCGRNAEYISEDPYLTGKLAAADVQGIQSQNIGASVKHFACNNKEVNRFKSDSIVSERALREIYLKGFEICVKEAAPWTIMTSYNIINGIHSSENYDMLTNILRGEWGFEGLVISDWGTQSNTAREVVAGNNVHMPTGFDQMLIQELPLVLVKKTQIGISYPDRGRGYLQQSVRRVLQMLLKID